MNHNSGKKSDNEWKYIETKKEVEQVLKNVNSSFKVPKTSAMSMNHKKFWINRSAIFMGTRNSTCPPPSCDIWLSIYIYVLHQRTTYKQHNILLQQRQLLRLSTTHDSQKFYLQCDFTSLFRFFLIFFLYFRVDFLNLGQ